MRLPAATTRAEANGMVKKYRAGWVEGTWPPSRAQDKDHTVKAMLDRYVRERDMSKGVLTQRSIPNNLNNAFGPLQVRLLDQYHLAEYMKLGIRSQATLSKELTYLCAAMRWAKFNWREWADTPEPPEWHPVKSKARETFWNARQISSILAGTYAKGEIEIMVYLCVFTGTRIDVAHRLTWDRIDFERRTIDFKVPGRPDTKKRVQRGLKVSRQVMELLELHKEDGGGTATRVFTSSKWKLYQELHAILKEQGLPYGSFHTFRHSWATNALENGMSVPSVALYLNVSPALVLATYGKPGADAMARGASLYD